MANIVRLLITLAIFAVAVYGVLYIGNRVGVKTPNAG
jgi:hypothetical protein